MILRTLAVGPFASNCYLVGSEKTNRGMVIDPGAERDTILRNIEQLKLSIILIVATHTHVDHIGALQEIKDATGAEFALHEKEYENWINKEERGFVGLMPGLHGQPVTPDRFLKENDVIEIDDLHFTVLDTPGHSPGGICLEGHGIVFSGDTLFNFGIGRTDFPGCSHTQLIDSINSKLMTLPDNTAVYPGHGPETTVGAERRINPFLTGVY
jgi:glyoxylase-like metal-dependent hydrolase (beta-lactamase superfamily II)